MKSHVTMNMHSEGEKLATWEVMNSESQIILLILYLHPLLHNVTFRKMFVNK